MEQTFSDQFMKENIEFCRQNMMGPNVIRVAEELASNLEIKPKMRILDLGCGAGLSSIFLAQNYGAQVVAADLWIDPTENNQRFVRFGLQDKIFPLSLDATKPIPFAKQYFDIIFSVDAYHYFGFTDTMLPHLLPCLRSGGHIAVAVPGIKQEWNSIPTELQPFLEENIPFYTALQWQTLWQTCPDLQAIQAKEMQCHTIAWQEWLQCGNPYAKEDRDMLAAEKGKYFNHIQLIAKKK